MKIIQLTQGQVALVDDDDYEWLNKWKWYAKKAKFDKTYYAYRRNGTGQLTMHFVIMGVKGIDHIDGNGLNNQRYNLRVVTVSQNTQNAKGYGLSKYKGVSLNKHSGKWMAQICVNGKRIYLGSFYWDWDAAQAYNRAAIKYFGEFAFLNTYIKVI